MLELLGYLQLRDCLQDAPPLRMLDRLEIDAAAGHARAVKCVSMDEEFFQGHFPGQPIMPGVLQVGAMAQVAEVLIRRQISTDQHIVLEQIQRLKFRQPVAPGDLLVVEVELRQEGEIYIGKAKTMVNDGVTSQGELLFRAVSKASATAAATPTALLEPLPEYPGETYDILRIMSAIPHRFPFLLIDRILAMDPDNQTITVLKNITGNEPYMLGSALATVPPYLQVEMAAQAGCALSLAMPGNQDKLAYFMSIDEAVFHAPVLPGDQLRIQVAVNGRGRFGKADCTLCVGDQTVTEAKIKFAVVDREG